MQFVLWKNRRLIVEKPYYSIIIRPVELFQNGKMNDFNLLNFEYLNTMDLQSLQKYDLVSEHIDPTVKTGNQPLDWKTLSLEGHIVNVFCLLLFYRGLVIDTSYYYFDLYFLAQSHDL